MFAKFKLVVYTYTGIKLIVLVIYLWICSIQPNNFVALVIEIDIA